MDSVSKLAERMGGIREYIVYALGSRRAISRCGWLVAMVVCVVVAVGCATDKRSAELIAYAEEIAMELPDSALRVVQSIDPESVHGRHDRAHYKLVVAEAHYYNRLAVDRDTIAQPLFDYYIECDNHAERARALYQHALVMQAEGENARAMFSLMEAEKSLEHLDNPRLSGLVHRTKGHIYGVECLFQNALEEYQKSKEYFDKAELSFHSAYALYNIATAYSKLRDYDNAIKYLLKSEEQFSENGYSLYQFETQIELCYNYLQIDDFNSCANIFARIDKSANIGYSFCDYYCIAAIISAYNGNYDEVDSLIYKATQEPITSQMQLSYAQYIIDALQDNTRDALSSYISMISEQDKSVFNAINNSLLQSQVDLLSDQVASSKEIQQKTRFINYLLTILSVGIVLIFIYYIKDKQHKHQVEIAQYISTIKELQMTTKDLPSQMNDSIDKLFKSRFKELNDLYDIYYDSVGSTRQMKIVFEQINNTINSIKCDKKRLAELEKIVNEYRGNMMSKLLDLCPNLSERQQKIVLFSYAGFSLRAIALFMDSNPTQISKDKYKIKGIIKSCGDTKDTELFINSL